jgi:cell division protein FtsQ
MESQLEHISNEEAKPLQQQVAIQSAKFNWKRLVVYATWVLAGLLLCVVLISAVQAKNNKICAGVEVSLNNVEGKEVIEKQAVLKILEEVNLLEGVPLASLPLQKLEAKLEENPWIRNAELYIDNQQILQIKIDETEPVARIFTVQNHSFYIDELLVQLPLSDNGTINVPMFTEVPDKVDTALLQQIVTLATFIKNDSFLMAQIQQVYVNQANEFELIPTIGHQTIKLGTANQLIEKFTKLKAFYKQVFAQTAFEQYRELDLRFAGQLVATRRGSQAIYSDSAKAMQVIDQVITQSTRSMVKDTAIGGLQITEQLSKPNLATAISPMPKPTMVTTPKPTTKSSSNKKQPRAVMPKKS